MDRFEHGRIAAFRIDIARGRDAQAAGQRSRQVAQDVGVQGGGHDGVQRRRTVDHARGGGINQFLVPRHIRELAADLQRDLVPHHHGMALRRRMRSTPARVMMETSVAASMGCP
ncbi:hypothetical protein G6F32_015964 [Rhizopus arrhizus]|nr:hypothetical protein G6F32_015964 [Rhizopus arrhizus]